MSGVCKQGGLVWYLCFKGSGLGSVYKELSLGSVNGVVYIQGVWSEVFIHGGTGLLSAYTWGLGSVNRGGLVWGL